MGENHDLTAPFGNFSLVICTNVRVLGDRSALLDEHEEEGGYQRLIERTFLPLVAKTIRRSPGDGVVAVIHFQGVGSGVSPLTLAYAKLSNPDGEEMPVQIVDAMIKVE